MEEAMTNHNSPADIRELWQKQAVTPFEMTAEERALAMQRQYRQFRIWRYPLIAIVLLVVIVLMGILFFGHGNIYGQVGFCLLIPCVVYGFLRERRYALDRKASFAKAEALGNTGSLDFYRAQLVRQLEQYRGTLWVSVACVPAFILMEIGMHPDTPVKFLSRSTWISLGALFVFYAGILILNALDVSSEAKKCRAKIAVLDALGKSPR
jgi:hypothetical protein